MKNAGSLYNKGKTNVELSSIYLGIWPHYIGNPHTNERDLSAGIDRLPRACSTSLADLSLQLHTTSGVAEIYICNNLGRNQSGGEGAEERVRFGISKREENFLNGVEDFEDKLSGK